MNTERISELRQFYHRTLLEDIIPFWERSDLIDREYGGFISSVDREGKLYNTDKSVWFQGRTLWTFSKLCNSYGVKETWLSAAKAGADFIRKYCIDPADGRMYFVVTREGAPLRKRRYFFSESFLVVGFAEYYLLSKDPEDLSLARKYFRLMYDIYDNSSNDPFKITPKENAQVRSLHANANPMVLVSSAQTLLRIDPDNAAYYHRVIDRVIHDMLKLHYKPELHCMLETVYSNGDILDNPTGRTINPGHSIENAWFLMNRANQTGDKALLEKALNILRWSLELGWDQEYGGIYYFRDLYGRPCEQLEHDMKLWWVHNECLIAVLMALQLTGDSYFEQWYDRLHDYIFSHFPDKVHGEWYGYLHRDGTVSHSQKGSLWKGPYHLPRCLMLCETILGAMETGTAIPPLL